MHKRAIERARLRSLRFSTIEGFFCSVMTGFGESCFGAFALLLGAGTWHLAILEGVPSFLGGISQLFTLPVLERIRSRKLMVCLGAGLQALVLAPIALLPFFGLGSSTVGILIALVTIYFTSAMITAPAWNSWMGDLVAAGGRSTYFGRRSSWTTLGHFLSLIVSGLLLKVFTDRGHQATGFAVVLAVAMGSRLLSAYFLSRKVDMPCAELGRPRRAFRHFLSSLPETRAGRVALYAGIVHFATLMTGAYFTPYVLAEVGGSYAVFFAFTAVFVLSTSLASRAWGRMSQVRGTAWALRHSGWLIAAGPLFWLVPGAPALILFSQVVNGVGRAGWNLAILTSVYEATEPHERAGFIGHMNVMNAILGLAGALTGAGLVSAGPRLGMPHAFGAVFVVGILIRFGSWVAYVSAPEPGTEIEQIPAQAA